MRYSIYKKIILVFILGIFVLSASLLQAAPEKKIKYEKSKHGLESLTRLNKDRNEMIRILKEETNNYEAVKNAIFSHQLQRGSSAHKIIKLYGKPVITFSEPAGTGLKWLYKPSSASFFSKEKIYLIFDKNNNLTEWILGI